MSRAVRPGLRLERAEPGDGPGAGSARRAEPAADPLSRWYRGCWFPRRGRALPPSTKTRPPPPPASKAAQSLAPRFSKILPKSGAILTQFYRTFLPSACKQGTQQTPIGQTAQHTQQAPVAQTAQHTQQAPVAQTADSRTVVGVGPLHLCRAAPPGEDRKGGAGRRASCLEL
ncbi:unnamed protein product [Rangifer tarandus platyrhynchus]|uniref:Uncharacterized protein n=2 Tax=Rangifer tarandus platyrhynchus TaxID=3082113 RepID=A0ACB0FMK6_RANTA|nr:unnamed protein product [Rangifer tarandus platyrhynchus]CAI9714380.1 unnamed protein product [Rangifer tarandus platyrhynchus]